MKKLLMLALATTLGLISCEKAPLFDDSNGQVTDLSLRRGADDPIQIAPANLPTPVSRAFKTAYPAARGMEWEAENGNTWKVKFFLGSQRMEALYAANGKLIWIRKK